MSGKGKCIVMNYNAQRKNCDDEYTKAGNDFFYLYITLLIPYSEY